MSETLAERSRAFFWIAPALVAGTGILVLTIDSQPEARTLVALAGVSAALVVSLIGRTTPQSRALNRVDPVRRAHDVEGTAELARVRDLAIEESHAKGRLLAQMSHEVRTPMAGIIGMSELLCETALDATQSEYARTIRDSALALLAIVDDILDLSKIEAGKVSLRIVEFDLSGLLNDVASLLSPRARAKGLELVHRTSPEVPDRLLGDPVRLRQILINLVGNAVKFTDVGEVVLEARVLVETEAGVSARISVRDTGAGIARESHEKVFEAFHQLDPDDPSGRTGVGLGLAICRNLTRLMGGRIGVESELGRGCTFWAELTFPRALASAPPSSGAAPARPVPAVDGLRVLIVEDNQVNRLVTQRMLELWGCRCESVNDGRQALDALENTGDDPFDLVLMDVQMPGMDGIAATKEIRRREAGTDRRVPVIAMTAHAMEGDRTRCLAAGMDGYSSKPVRFDALRATLAHWSPRERVAWSSPACFRPEGLRASCGSDPAMIGDVLDVFLRETPSRIGRIEDVLRSGRFDEVVQLAHAFEGGCLVVGAEGMAEALRALEAHGRRGDNEGVHSTFSALAVEWTRLRTELLGYLESIRSGDQGTVHAADDRPG